MLLDETVVQGVITDLESELEKDAEKWAVPADKVQWSARWVLDRIRVGVVKAREGFVSIPKAEAATGWPAQTLRRNARRKLVGAPVAGWEGFQARRRGKRDYEVQISSIPPRPE